MKKNDVYFCFLKTYNYFNFLIKLIFILVKKNIHIISLTLLFIIIFLNSSFAQVEQIQPDRPDQTESPKVIPVNYFQFESGIVFEKDVEQGFTSKEISYPSLLLRYGILKNFEIRLELDNVSSSTEVAGVSNNIKGIKPITLGFKVNICEEKGLRPGAGLIVNFAIPKLASNDFKSSFMGSSINLALENSISDKLSAGYNIGASWDGNTPETTFFYTLSFGYEFSSRISGFAEIYGFVPEKTRADHRFDFGLSLFALRNLAFDASAGLGITNNAPDFFINGGMSFRIPK